VLVLGIESSCDDTAAAVVRDGRVVLSSVVASQDSIHARYGGVVPELASRRHIEAVIPVVEEALAEAGVTMDEIDGIAVTKGPGLVGSILIGLSFAKAVSYARGIPLTGVNHIQAHPFAAFITTKSKGGDKAPVDFANAGRNEDNAPGPPFPLVALVVSGGHTTLIRMDGYLEYEVLGRTLDDAAGEAFDKAAKILGLGFPGGPAMERAAKKGSRTAIPFTRPYLPKKRLDFSFSGIKTAVFREVDALREKDALTEKAVADIAASFQEAVTDVLVKKAILALEDSETTNLVIAGGVACNSRLREKLQRAAEKQGLNITAPPKKFCSDNAAFVAAIGYHQLKKGMTDGTDLNAIPAFADMD